MNMTLNPLMNHGMAGLGGVPKPGDRVGVGNVARQGGVDVEQPAAPKGEARLGAGELGGREVRVGDGQQRGEALKAQEQHRADPSNKPGLIERMRTFLGLHSMTTFQARSEAVFASAHAEALKGLREPKAGSLALDSNVMSRVQAHAQKQGTQLNAEQLKELVTVGENLALKLVKSEPPGIASGVYTTRALAWFMMAQAAAQDAQRPEGNARSDMTNKGSFVMKDPDNKVYNFLKSAPTCSTRMSTHFAERVDHGDKHSILGIKTSKPANQGIEDFRSLMPGTGGTMLFDKLTKGELFVKFETVGCPPYFVSSERGGEKVSRFFCSLGRNTMHALNFLQSVFGKSGSAAKVERQEHVYKGSLQKNVFEPFKKLVTDARNAGVLNSEWKSVEKSVKKTGMPFVEAQIDLIREAAIDRGSDDIGRTADQLKLNMKNFIAELVGPAGNHDIERRGAEVHISIDPSARLQGQPA